MDDYVETFDARGHLYNEANSDWPDARACERDQALDRLGTVEDLVVVDAPAGGGYVADGLLERCRGRVEIICVEPSASFAQAISNQFETIVAPLDSVPLPDRSVDRIVSLAGLHHVADKRPIYREWRRLLKQGGRIAVGDVGTETGTGEFLNTFVDRNTPGGHDGQFIAPGEFAMQLDETGFEVLDEALEDVPWHFRDWQSLGRFCQSLFGITGASDADTAAALRELVGVRDDGDQLALAWQLRYATAIRVD